MDLAGAYVHGLPATAYTRADAQSDLLHALCCCPYYFTSSSNFDVLELVTVAWSCRGALLWSLSTALCGAPYHHKSMSVMERCEAAVTGYILQDLWQILAAKSESDAGVRVGSMSMSPVTVANIQSLSLSMVVLLLHKQESSPKISILRVFKSHVKGSKMIQGYTRYGKIKTSLCCP